jgi:hypothetical protein
MREEEIDTKMLGLGAQTWRCHMATPSKPEANKPPRPKVTFKQGMLSVEYDEVMRCVKPTIERLNDLWDRHAGDHGVRAPAQDKK